MATHHAPSEYPPPVDSQKEFIKRELDDVTKEFEQLNSKDLPAVNEAVKAKGLPPVAYSPEETPSQLAVRFFRSETEAQATEQE